MDDGQKIGLIAEALDIDEGAISAETVLDDLEEWDSMNKLSLIVMFDDEFGKTLKSDDIKGFKIVGDIMAAMG